MIVKNLEDRELELFINFNKLIYTKKIDIEKTITHKFFENPFSENTFDEIIIAKENEDIVGQIALMPSKFSYNNKVYNAFWGMDYIVKEEHRGTAAGIILVKKALKKEYHFGMCLSDSSLKIVTILGEKTIGYLTKYIKIVNLFDFCKSFFYTKQLKKDFVFPDKISLKKSEFVRLKSADQIKTKKGYWNTDVLEFIRDEKFIKWRFFNQPNKYYVYQYYSKNERIDNDAYFVIRPIFWKNLNCLLIVDYRFKIEDKDIFREILKGVTKVAKNLKFSAIITASSFYNADISFKRHLYFRYGKKREIVCNFKDLHDKNINLFITHADSDNDFNF